MNRTQVQAIFDELEKIAIKFRGLHGTNNRWPELVPAFGGTLQRNDRNPIAVYAGIKKRSIVPGIEWHAHRAVARRGGTPVIGQVKIDTSKGWVPHTLTPAALKEGLTIDDIHDVIRQLDSPNTPRAERGELWKTLNKSTGAWLTPSSSPTKVTKYRDVTSTPPHFAI